MLVVKAIGGLCNRLRTLFSYNQYAKFLNKKLVFIWNKNEQCTGLFLDYFEPVENILFLENNNDNLNIDYTSHHGLSNYPSNYSELKLLPSILEKIKEKINILERNYISFHIRRTDHINYAKNIGKYVDDNFFIDFIEKNLQDKNLFIAADNKETYNLFKSKYETNVKFDYYNTIINKTRQTTLEESIIDIYVCVYSSKFTGTTHSSFSALIDALRKSNKYTIENLFK